MPLPLEVLGPVTVVPSLEELERLTSVPEQRRCLSQVDWRFYETLVDSIPRSSPIHVDFDGKDVEVMVKGLESRGVEPSPGKIVSTSSPRSWGFLARAWGKPRGNVRRLPEVLRPTSATTFNWKSLLRLAQSAGREARGISWTIPNPTWRSRSTSRCRRLDRAGIYAAMRVSEVWRFVDERLVIDRLRADGRYEEIEASGFLPVTAEEVTRWVVEEDSSDESAWARRLRIEIGRTK